MIFFYLLISVMPLSRHPIWSRFMGDLTVVKYLGGVSLLYAILYLGGRRNRPRLLRTWQARWFLALAFLAFASFAVHGEWRGWQIHPVLSYASFVLLLFITVVVVDSQARLRAVLLVAVGSVGLASLYVIREWQKFHTAYEGFRPGWVVGDPNYFSISAVLCLPIAYCLVRQTQPRWERLFCAACLVVTLLATTLAASRGGFLGMVAAFLVVAWNSRQRLRNLALAGVLIFPLSLLSPSSPLERLLRPGSGDEQAIGHRTTVWKVGLRMVAANPLQGIGLARFQAVEEQYAKAGEMPRHIAHNSYLEIAAELGLPAFVAFAGVLACSFRTLAQTVRRTRRAESGFLHRAALGMEAGLAGAAVSIFFASGQYQKLLWLMLFLSMCFPPLLACLKNTEPAPADKQEVKRCERSGD